MPVDEFGNRADVIADGSSSTISRMNAGRVYEQYLGAYSRDNKQRLVNMFSGKYGPDFINKLTGEDITYILQYLRGMASHINSQSVAFIDSLDEETALEHIRECLTEEIYLFYPPNNERNILDVILSIENSEYRPNLGKVSFKDEYGNVVTTNKNVRIGVMRIAVLDKVAESYSAVSSAKLNSFNFPIKGGRSDKYKYPHSLTPTTTMSETEIRILASFAGPELAAELIDGALNPITHKNVIRGILEGKDNYNKDFNVNRESNEYGQTTSLMLLKHVFNSFGFDFEYIEQD